MSEVLVTRDSLSLPAGCSPRQVAGVIAWAERASARCRFSGDRAEAIIRYALSRYHAGESWTASRLERAGPATR
jgi:hypothetical protein